MSYYNIYIGDKPYQLYIEDIAYDISDDNVLPDNIYGKLSVTYDDSTSSFTVKVDSLSNRGKYAMKHNRLYVVPEVMVGSHFSSYRSLGQGNYVDRKVRENSLRNTAGNYWGLAYTAINNRGQNNNPFDGEKIDKIGEILYFPRTTFIYKLENFIACHSNSRIGVNAAWSYVQKKYDVGREHPDPPIWAKVRFYLICFDKDPNGIVDFTRGVDGIPSFRFKKTISPEITLYSKLF